MYAQKIVIVPVQVVVASASTSVVVGTLKFRYRSAAVPVPSIPHGTVSADLNGADAWATLIVPLEVPANDAITLAIVLLSVTLDATAVPSEIASVELAFSVDAIVLVVIGDRDAIAPRMEIAPSGKSYTFTP